MRESTLVSIRTSAIVSKLETMSFPLATFLPFTGLVGVIAIAVFVMTDLRFVIRLILFRF